MKRNHTVQDPFNTKLSSHQEQKIKIQITCKKYNIFIHFVNEEIRFSAQTWEKKVLYFVPYFAFCISFNKAIILIRVRRKPLMGFYQYSYRFRKLHMSSLEHFDKCFQSVWKVSQPATPDFEWKELRVIEEQVPWEIDFFGDLVSGEIVKVVASIRWGRMFTTPCEYFRNL